ncbi:unnamed protein product [Rotaria magnacalcarata]
MVALGSSWTHQCIPSSVELLLTFSEDIIGQLSIRDYGSGMIENNKDWRISSGKLSDGSGWTPQHQRRINALDIVDDKVGFEHYLSVKSDDTILSKETGVILSCEIFINHQLN